jgi:hypothetical protein
VACLSPAPMLTLSMLWALAWKLLIPAVLLVALVDVLTQSQPQRIRRLSRAGLSQRAIAQRCAISRYRVRLVLA